jgi:hypothetical protein
MLQVLAVPEIVHVERLATPLTMMVNVHEPLAVGSFFTSTLVMTSVPATLTVTLLSFVSALSGGVLEIIEA